MSTSTIRQADYAEQLSKLSKELLKLKKMQECVRPVVSLKGALKGVKITDREIQEAKKSLFKKITV